MTNAIVKMKIGAASPVSQERFTRSTGGTSYGIEMSCSQAGPILSGSTFGDRGKLPELVDDWDAWRESH